MKHNNSNIIITTIWPSKSQPGSRGEGTHGESGHAVHGHGVVVLSVEDGGQRVVLRAYNAYTTSLTSYDLQHLLVSKRHLAISSATIVKPHNNNSSNNNNNYYDKNSILLAITTTNTVPSKSQPVSRAEGALGEGGHAVHGHRVVVLSVENGA